MSLQAGSGYDPFPAHERSLPGDPDQVVTLVASKLLSDDGLLILQGSNLIRIAGEHYNDVAFSRLVQELCVYKGSAIPQKLLAEVERKASLGGGFTHLLVDLQILSCLMALVNLARSKVALDWFLRDSGVPEKLVRIFVAMVQLMYRPNCNQGVIGSGLLGLLVFAQQSKKVRDTIMILDSELGLYASLKELVAKPWTEGSHTFAHRILVARVLLVLANSADTRLWLVEKGLLRLLVSFYEIMQAKQVSRLTKHEIDGLYTTYNNILFRSLKDEEVIRKLQSENALDMLRPFQRMSIKKKQFADVEDFWLYVYKKLSAQSPFATWGLKSKEPGWTWLVKTWKEGENDVFNRANLRAPIVCSWKDCDAVAGEGGMSEGKLNQCGSCRIAHYCREHQKLHWRSHKPPCQAVSSAKGLASADAQG